MPSSRSRTRSRGRGRGRSRSRGRGRSRSAQRGRSRSMRGGIPLRGGRGGSYGSANIYGGPTMDSSSSSLGSAPFHQTISIMKSQQ